MSVCKVTNLENPSNQPIFTILTTVTEPFKKAALSRYLELSERAMYRNVVKSCSLSIPHKKSTAADSQIKKIRGLN